MTRTVTSQRASSVGDVRAELGEGAVWDHRHNVLWWVDILTSRLYRYSPDEGRTDRFDVGQHVSAVGLRIRGALVLAVRDGFAGFDPASDELTTIARVGHDSDARMNDGAVSPRGDFWAGSMAYDERPGGGALYRLDSSGRVICELPHVTCSNGIGWDPERDRMYYVDTATRRIDVAEGESVADRRPFVSFGANEGLPDGLAVDAAGGVWIALWDGAQVRRYGPDGVLTHVVRLTATRPTRCALGGADLKDLWITTAVGAGTDAGALFHTRVDIPGRRSWAYLG